MTFTFIQSSFLLLCPQEFWFRAFEWMEADAPPPRLFANRIEFPDRLKPFLPTAVLRLAD